MKEEKLQVFIDGVQKYFAQMIIGEELVVGTPYLIENKIPSAKDFTGVIAISGKNQGVVYFTAPRELLERLLVLIGEKDTSEALMVDLVGEVAKLDKRSLVALLFSPGFSTAGNSNEDAGRGVGLDIIKDRVVSLKGTVNVASRPQGYTRFSFTLPKN